MQQVRAVRRIPIDERWGKDNRKWVKRAPWHRYKGDEYQDGGLPEEVEVEETNEGKAKGNEKLG